MAYDPAAPEPPPLPAGDDPMDSDPLLEECIRDALGPYLGALSPEEQADYRRMLAAFLTTHPAAAPRYERLRRRPVPVAGSGEVAREGEGAEEPGDARGDGTFGGPR